MGQGYDVIVAGARVAGAATAMLLARQGLRVLVVDRTRFPSDTLSTHQIQLPGVARLRRWGLLDRLSAAGTPATRRVVFDLDGFVLDGRFPTFDGVNALYSPRRTVLDAILVESARDAGAEVREDFLVEDLIWSDGRVTGIRGRSRGGHLTTEAARLVVGADGKHSTVGRATGAHIYRERPASTIACYTYWSGVAMDGGELYQRPDRAVAAFPTNDDLTMILVVAPIAEFETYRADVEGYYRKTLDMCGDLGERVRGATRAERFRTTPDLPNALRVPCGPGWALVGDAGLVMDPITAQGISYAFRDAELLTDVVAANARRDRPLDTDLRGYHRRRDKAATPMYDLTCALATLAPDAALRQLLASLVGRQDEIDRFLGVFAGAVPVKRYLSLRNVLRLLGIKGFVSAALARSRT